MAFAEPPPPRIPRLCSGPPLGPGRSVTPSHSKHPVSGPSGPFSITNEGIPFCVSQLRVHAVSMRPRWNQRSRGGRSRTNRRGHPTLTLGFLVTLPCSGAIKSELTHSRPSPLAPLPPTTFPFHCELRARRFPPSPHGR